MWTTVLPISSIEEGFKGASEIFGDPAFLDSSVATDR